MRDRFNKWQGRIHAAMYRMTKGKLGAKMGKAPVLLLTTTGRKSGQPRTSPLFYVVDGARFVIVASNAGQAHAPAWFANLKANPNATIEVKGEKHAVTGREGTDEERAKYWPELLAIYKTYDNYQQKTARPIPVVVLDPA